MNSENNVVPSGKFMQRVQERLAQEGKIPPAGPVNTAVANPSAPAVHVVPDDHIPDIEIYIDPEQEALDKAIKDMSILDAYAKWCGKMVPKPGGKRESIHVSCPDPTHPDLNPSAWVNLDKNTYYCPGCAVGGDVWDIAAFFFGISYKGSKEEFRKLREFMAIDMGFDIVKGYGGTYVVPPEEEVAGSPAPVPVEATPAVRTAPAEAQEAQAPVGMLPAAVAEEQTAQQVAEDNDGPSIDWRTIVPENTFLREWLVATTVDNCPEEYHFWTGLMAIGFAMGRRKQLWDLRPVNPNLFACLVGPSGAGKSRAKEHLNILLDRTLRYDHSRHSGVKTIKSPGSAEYLVQAFNDTEEDPNSPGASIIHPVSALVEFAEMSSLMAIGGRAGSALKPQLMDIYDANLEVSSGSLTHGLRVAREPFGSCISTTQTESLRKLLDKGDDASGFMNRWVFASGKLKPQVAIGGAVVDVDEPAKKLNALYMWSQRPSVIQWSQPAADLWTEFFHKTLVPTKDANEQSGSAMLNRIDLLMKKLILLFTGNIMADVVPKAAVEQAIQVYDYLITTYGGVSAQLERTDDSDLVAKVLTVIEKLTAANKLAPTKRDIYQSVRRTLKTTEQLAKLLKHMVELEVIKEITPARKPGQRGQLGVRYAVNS